MGNFSRRQKGFTLLEMVVVIAVIGILAGIAGASTVAVVGGSKTRALSSEQEEVEKAVGQFVTDLRKGPTEVAEVGGGLSHQWGTGSLSNHYPTEDGLVGSLELSSDTFDAENPDNPRVDVYQLGPGTGGAAADSDITASLLWMGLLVNEPFSTTPGDENKFPGTAHPLEGEQGQYLSSFPDSAAEANTDTDSNTANGNGKTDGSYHWVVLQDGKPVAIYKSGGVWYSGSNKNKYP